MNVSSVSSASAGTTDHAARADNGANAAAGQFASALALLLGGAPKPAPAPVPQADGASELDQAEVAADATEPGSAGENKSDAAATDVLTATASLPPSEVVRSVAALDPQLQAKLARVMSRVRDETGHDVKVAETTRSQARQDALYAQGRQTPGQVVTWTRHSKHLDGRAVDVELEGSAGTKAYATLRRIANEEGLRTLGARDPGHLELPTTAAASDVKTSMLVEPADASGQSAASVARLSRVAQAPQLNPTAPVAKLPQAAPVAQVATVAHVDQVAQVAQVASAAQPTRLGAARTAGVGARDAQTIGGTTVRVTSVMHNVQSVAGRAAANAANDERSGDPSGDRGSQNGDAGGYAAFNGGVSSRHQAFDLSAAPVAPTAGADAVARAERVMNAMENAPARPLSHITMSVDAGNGTMDRVHVALRGNELNATIDTADNRAAQLMSARTDELSRALSKDGVELRELRVRAATETGTVTAAAAAQSSQTSADASTQSRFDRGNAWQQHQDQQDQQERQRSNSERRQQQRQQRGSQQ